MELFKALKTVVDLQGNDILKDSRLINILSDFKAYEETPAAKFLLKILINEGLMAKLLVEHNSFTDISTLIATNKGVLSDIYGFKDNVSEYVLNCLAYAQGWTDEIPSLATVSNDNLPNSSQSKKVEVTIDDGKHLLFKQFPITGDVNALIKQLSSSGYTIAEPYNYVYNAASLIGSFAGNNDCNVAVIGTPRSHLACGVMVFLQEHHIWYTIKDQYEKIKNQLTKKYGNPETYEYFLDPFYEGDGSELTALFSDHCTWMSIFKTAKGTISVSMTSKSKVLITYQDKINQEIREQEASSIADDDL